MSFLSGSHSSVCVKSSQLKGSRISTPKYITLARGSFWHKGDQNREDSENLFTSPSPAQLPKFTLERRPVTRRELWPQVTPDGSTGKESVCQYRRHKRCGFDPWGKEDPLEKKWQPTPVFLPGKFHGQRSLAGYSTKIQTWLSTHAPFYLRSLSA